MDNYTAPEWDRSALITIDTQCDTLDNQPFEIPGTTAILPRMKALLAAFRSAGRAIIHIVRIYQADGSNVDLCRKELVQKGARLLLAGTPGCQPAADLLPREGIRLDEDQLLSHGIQTIGDNEVVIYKPRWGAFYQTPLELHLGKQNISTLVFCGCNFPNCPRTSIYEASERDFRVVLVDDAVSGLYDQGRIEMRKIGVELLSTSLVIDAVSRTNKFA
jgi:nicotinamidase-related amidase